MNHLVEQDILRMLNIIYYKLGKTVSENLMEQPDSKMPFQIERFGYKQGDPSTLAPALKRQKEAIKQISDLFKDPHDVLLALSLGATTLGMIPTPFSPFLLALGTAADVADALLYYKEGDHYLGTIMLALAVIPGGEWIKLTKKTVLPEVAKNLIRKAKKGIKNLAPKEIEQLKRIFINVDLNKSLISTYLRKNMIDKIIASLPTAVLKFGVKYSLKTIFGLFKIARFLTKFTITIGATAYGADLVYLYFYGNTKERSKRIKELNELSEAVKKYFGGDSEKFRKETLDQTLEKLKSSEFKEELNKQTNNSTSAEKMLKFLQERMDSKKGNSSDNADSVYKSNETEPKINTSDSYDEIQNKSSSDSYDEIENINSDSDVEGALN
jgi:hypothetical protein